MDRTCCVTSVLKINLADVLLGKASTEHADVMLLTFSDAEEARAAFRMIPARIELQEQQATLHVQLWFQGAKEAETSCCAACPEESALNQ